MRLCRLKHIIRATLVFSIVSAFAARPSGSQALADGEAPYWQQGADYTIEASLDTRDHLLAGTEIVSYTNNSPDTLREFYLHLYANAFRDKTSQLIRDYLQGTLYFFVGLPESMRGWIDVSDLAVNGRAVEFTVDGTILASDFPKPLLPGETAVITLSFREKIMRRLGRMGWAGEHYDMAQWYPKMAVYDGDGWHPDQYRMGEFYGEFGTFDVSVTLPEKYVVAATGLPVSGDPGWTKNAPRPEAAGGGGGGHPGGRPSGDAASGEAAPATKTVRFRAERVHDFAWCANPSFVVQDSTVSGVRVMSFFRPWNRPWADSTLAQGIRAVRWLEGVAGPFPYPQISIVDSPTRGGMEYPMLVMNGYVDDGLVLHELAHIYFYGALGNDERAEAWLDEGLAQYSVFWRAEEAYGPYGPPSERPWPFSLFRERRMWDDIERPVVKLHRTGFAERIATPAHEFKNGFSTMPYIGAPLFLRALRYTVGDENFREIVSTYVDRWKFKHVDEEAFRSVCEEVSGMDLKELFRQWLHTTKSCDYRLARFRTKRTKDGWSADLRIDRKGELMMPVTLAVRLADGNTVTERFDGVSRTITDTLRFESKPVRASINPDNEILDVYRLDNVSPRRRHFTLLDVPFNRYYPPDAFSYRFLPVGYYNDVDGGKAGLRMRGSFDDTYRKFTLQGLYGFESGVADVYGSYRHPIGYLGRDAVVSGEAFIREGRQGASLELSKIRRKSLYDPFAHTITLGLSYHELTDEEYVRPFTYEKGMNFKGKIALAFEPETDIFASRLSFSLERTLWGSDFDTEKLNVSLALSPGLRSDFLPVKPHLRFFLGRAMNDAPVQERFQLAGAGTLAKENRFWLRSVGAWPADYYGNFHVPGDANLRGYFDGTFAFKQIFSSNVELELPFPILLPLSRPLARALDRKLYLFFDWGKVLDARPLEGLAPWERSAFDENYFDGILLDSGVGVSIWKLTAEFPLYLSHPALVGQDEKWDLRWTIGFERLF